MPKVSDFLEVLEGFAPSFLKMPGDNVGLLVGDPSQEVSHVMLTLSHPLSRVRRLHPVLA